MAARLMAQDDDAAAVVDFGGPPHRQRLVTAELPEHLVDDFRAAANASNMSPERLLAQLVRGYLTRRSQPRNDRWP